MKHQGYSLVLLAIIVSFMFDTSFAIQCWKCTSQTDATCRDYFNTTRILLNQRHMDSYSYGNLQPARTDPHLSPCDGMHTSTFGQFKNVCLKRVISVPNGLHEVHRECRMVHKDMRVGDCPDEILNNRPRDMEFCGTCEYDGCNSATTNSIVFVGLVPALVLLLGK